MSPTPMTPYVVDGDDGKKTPTSVPTDQETIVIAVDDDDDDDKGQEDCDDLKDDDNNKDTDTKDKVCLLNGTIVKSGRPAIYKRVSFGSSKGSMVETMVIQTSDDLTDSDVKMDDSALKPPSKVKVTFYESQKPHFVSTPDSGDIPIDFVNGNTIMSSPTKYYHRASTDSGVDNPFRPDGELSKEAENIVIVIKDGKPIVEEVIQSQANGTITTSPPSSIHKPAVNGTTKPGVVEVEHGVVVPPNDGSQVEQVNIKKKPKCQCCVIQ